jgi:hypothetical protein
VRAEDNPALFSPKVLSPSLQPDLMSSNVQRHDDCSLTLP